MVEDERYDKHLAECIGLLWKSRPNQRFGQLLLNLTRDAEGGVDQHRLWNMENDELSELILNAIINDGK